MICKELSSQSIPTYLVKVQIDHGRIQEINCLLISQIGATPENAQEKALQGSIRGQIGNNAIRDNKGGYFDLDGKLHLTIKSCRLISELDAMVMRKYLSEL